MENHYLATLNLAPGATEQDIKRAYRRLARKYHPDRSSAPNAAARFIEITEAYRFLMEVGSSPQQQTLTYDHDSGAHQYKSRRQAAKQYARERAAERFRQRISATLQLNKALKLVIPVVALVELVYVIDYALPANQAEDTVTDISYFQHHITGQYELVTLQERKIPVKPEDIVQFGVGTPVNIATTPLLSIFLWVEVLPGPYSQRLYPAYNVYHGYHFLISLILFLCLVFAVFPLHSDNKTVAGVIVLLFFVVQLALHW